MISTSIENNLVWANSRALGIVFAFLSVLMITSYIYLMVTIKRHFPKDKLRKEKIVTTISVGLFTLLYTVRTVAFWYYDEMW